MTVNGLVVFLEEFQGMTIPGGSLASVGWMDDILGRAEERSSWAPQKLHPCSGWVGGFGPRVIGTLGDWKRQLLCVPHCV